MDIKTVYPGEQPSEADFLWGQSFAVEGFGHLLHDLLGTSTTIAGLACGPTTPASMSVLVGPGRMYAFQQLRPTGLGQIAGLGGLAPDTNADHMVIKQGLLRDTTTVGGGGSPFTAPITSGQSINYLIQAAFVEQDSTATQRVFYNTQNPQVAIPSNVADFRQCVVQLSVKAGSPATTGSQVTPTADSGNVPVWVINVPYGATTLTSANISQHGSAPYFSMWTAATLFNAQQQVLFSGEASATGVSGTLNDYNPTGWSTASVLGITTSGATTLNGLAGGVGGRLAIIRNSGSSTNDINIVANASGSATGNQFAALPPGQTQINIRPGASAIFRYGPSTGQWRLIAGANAAYASDVWRAINRGASITPYDLAQSAAFGSLTDASTIAWEIATNGFATSVTLGASGHTMGVPTLNGGALFDGCPVMAAVAQDATGGRTMTWATSAGGWDFGLLGAPTLPTGAGKVLIVSGVYRAAAGMIEASVFWRNG